MKYGFCLSGIWISIPLMAAFGQGFTDPGFESYTVMAGQFVKPDSGPWSFGNDAGVVEPFAPNSSTGPLNTWSAVFDPVDGQQYASTYAGSDYLRQSITFSAAGDYRISAYAAAPDGSVTIPTVATLVLARGAFTFTLGNNGIGAAHSVLPGSSWSLFSADFTIPNPGSYLLGVRNTESAVYFINYDHFELTAVPEPRLWQLLVLGGIVLGICRRRQAGSQPSP